MPETRSSLTLSYPHKITVCGSFGFGNAGDEALPLAIADLAKYLGIDLEIKVLSRFHQPDLIHVIGLDEFYRSQQSELKGYPILLSGGGILEPKDSSVIFRCQDYLKKSFTPIIALYAANVESGVKYNWYWRWKVRNMLKNFDRLYVRDILSAESLNALVPNKEVKVIGDAVLWLKPSDIVPEKILGLSRFVTVSLASHVSWKDDPNWLTWMSQQLNRLSGELEASIVFVSLSDQRNQDDLIHQKVATAIQKINSTRNVICLKQCNDPRQIQTVLSRSMLTISMRLHGCVMAYSQKVPFIGLTYHPKVLGFAKTVAWEKFCLPRQLPNTQSPTTYGYTFADSQLVNYDLLKIAQEAIAYSDFTQLEIYKNKLADAFSEILALSSEK